MENKAKFMMHDKVRVRIASDNEEWIDGKVKEITDHSVIVQTDGAVYSFSFENCTRNRIRSRK